MLQTCFKKNPVFVFRRYRGNEEEKINSLNDSKNKKRNFKFIHEWNKTCAEEENKKEREIYIKNKKKLLFFSPFFVSFSLGPFPHHFPLPLPSPTLYFSCFFSSVCAPSRIKKKLRINFVWALIMRIRREICHLYDCSRPNKHSKPFFRNKKKKILLLLLPFCLSFFILFPSSPLSSYFPKVNRRNPINIWRTNERTNESFNDFFFLAYWYTHALEGHLEIFCFLIKIN